MKLSLDALSAVAAVVREGSIIRAAEVLHKAPSTIWHTVKKLERDLGVQVLRKQGRGVTLTPEGKELLERGGLILELVGDLERSLEQISAGWESTLRIAVADVVPNEWIFSIISELQSVSPKTTISVSKEVLAGNWDAVISRRADLVVCAPTPPPKDRDVIGFELGRIEFVYAVAPNHPLIEIPDPLTPVDVASHRVVIVPDTSKALPVIPTRVIHNQPVLRVPDFEAKLVAQRQGIGVGYIAKHFAEPDINSGTLIHKTFIGDPYTEPVWIGWRKDSSGKALEWMINRLKSSNAKWLLDS